MEARLKISPSSVKTYEQCPRKYYYSYIEKLPKKTFEHFDLGTLVHGALEFFHSEYPDESKRPNDLQQLMSESLKRQWDKMIVKSNISRETFIDAKTLLKGYLSNIIKTGLSSSIIALEDSFEIQLNDEFVMRGVVDRVDLDNDGTLHIKDYKTNKTDKYMTPFQLQAYGLYLFNKYENIDKFKASYIMLKLGCKPMSYTFNNEDVEKVKNKLIEYAESIYNEEKWGAKPSKLCDWCDFKEICFKSW